MGLIAGLFRFFAEARHSRLDRYRDYAKESYHYDQYSNDSLLNGLDDDRFIRLGDITDIYKSVSARDKYRLSSHDHDEFVTPFINRVVHQIRRCEIECRMTPEEELPHDARVRVGDLAALFADYDFPDGSPDGRRASEVIAVAVDPDFGESPLGQWRQKIYNAAPLRTPSVDVTYEKIMAEHPLDICRPLILSIGLASVWKSQNNIIEVASIPTFQETSIQRGVIERKRREVREGRVYRGNKIK